MWLLYILLGCFGLLGMWAFGMAFHELRRRFDVADFIILMLSTAQILSCVILILTLYYGE